MYRYDEFDETIVRERVAQFADQVERRLRGELTEDQFKPLRLMNGLYLQIHAYMLRIAVPYGALSSRKLRQLAHIARTYDKGYGHFTTRQNLQLNWIKLPDVPEILGALADVEMHCIQTSGNCVRNVSSDQFAGSTPDETEDPRPWCEIIRQWSTFHPEFSFLPRKFKICVIASELDRAAMRTHDIGLHARRADDGGTVFDVYVGGGQGRTPFIAPLIREGIPAGDLLAYLEACLRVYNRYGRRDNIHKARIKILVASLGPEEYARQVDAEFEDMQGGALALPQAEIDRIRAYFAPPPFKALRESEAYAKARRDDPAFGRWARTNVHAHKRPGYASVTISLKAIGAAPGDISAEQMEIAADLGRTYSFDEIRVSHEQNLVLPHVEQHDLHAVYKALDAAQLATPNVGLISDIIACPGLDYCDLANARAIPVAQEISKRFADLSRQEEIGDLEIKISGCINACGHHHVGHIGILGVDKHGEEFYQILLGGRADEKARLGKITGKGMPAEAIPDAIERLVGRYLALRQDKSERFIEALERLGAQPFEEALYGA
jgi:sulfite reductase (NADPH) hemoprotein beta-component